MRGANALCAELEARGSRCCVAVVPKTIDNDIPLVVRGPGIAKGATLPELATNVDL